MSDTDRRIFANLDELGAAAADIFVAQGRAAVAARGRFVVALSGGSTPDALYSALRARGAALDDLWRATHFYWGDERFVPLTDPQSNYDLARRGLLDHIPTPPAQIFPTPVDAASPEAAAEAYARLIVANLGTPPVFDLNILGMGPDGHTASLFPGAPELDVTDRWVVATAQAHVGLRRITFSFPLINAARQVIFMVAGADKRDVLARVWAGDRDLPAARVQPASGPAIWLVDEAAANP